MKLVTNFAIYDGCLSEYGTMAELASDCQELGLDGIEMIWDVGVYTEEQPPRDLVVGHHMVFWAYWLDFWNGNREALLREFGDWNIVEEYYRGDSREHMIAEYREDLQRAISLDAEYVVFHVSDIAIEECYTYQFAHDNQEVIDAAIELINEILDGMDVHLAFLVENQWWPGFTFTDPALTRRLIDGIEYDNKGIMLDVGHLLHTNRKLRSQVQAAAYVREMYELHGDLASYVRGLHLHQSLTGEYVDSCGYRLPDDFPTGYWDRFTRCYSHVTQIDRHEPWSDPAIADVVAKINPEWVNNELSAWKRDARKQAVATQLRALQGIK